MPTTGIRTCVPAALDGSDWSRVEPVINELLGRTVATPAEFEQWLIDRSEVDAACREARADLYIANSCDTESAEKSAAFARFVEDVTPRLETAGFELDKKQADLSRKFPMDAERYEVLHRNCRAAVALFRAENVPIQTELEMMSQQFGKIAGAQSVQFDGREQTLPQMGAYQLSADRAEREGAWRAVASRRLQDRAALDELYTGMVERRDRMARNAGCSGFVEYVFKDKQRFDYSPEDCERFWNAAAGHVVPLMKRLDARRAERMGLAALRPWDLAVDPQGRPGLKPFRGGRELFEKTTRVFDALDPRLAALFRRMGPGDGAGSGPELVSEFLDLDTRKGKRPGGYQYNRARSRRPFIFMNAAGLHRDVMTMIHEAGHAFHSILCENEPLVDYRSSPIEFAEVASMSMEHLTLPHWGVPGGFYTSREELVRAQTEHLEHSITILSWIAAIDSFQHWIYTNPSHTATQRDDKWIEIDGRFGHALDWSGLTEERRSRWQGQPHLFSHPLYYIEYGIAQLGALSLWLKSRTEGQKPAVDAYIRALSLGGSRPLPALFEAAGLEFDFGDATVARVCREVEKELDRLA